MSDIRMRLLERRCREGSLRKEAAIRVNTLPGMQQAGQALAQGARELRQQVGPDIIDRMFTAIGKGIKRITPDTRTFRRLGVRVLKDWRDVSKALNVANNFGIDALFSKKRLGQIFNKMQVQDVVPGVGGATRMRGLTLPEWQYMSRLVYGGRNKILKGLGAAAAGTGLALGGKYLWDTRADLHNYTRDFQQDNNTAFRLN